MRTKRTFLTIGLVALFAAPGLAQREAPVRRGEILQRLDQNQDGRLDESERAAARDELRRRVESRGREIDASTPRSGRLPLERGPDRFTREDGTGRGMQGRDMQGRGMQGRGMQGRRMQGRDTQGRGTQGRGMRGRGMRGRGAEGTDRRARGAAPRVRGPLGRGLERRFGNGDGRVGPLERMRLRRLAERMRGDRGGAAQGARPEGRRGRGAGEGRRGARSEPPRTRRPNSGGEDF